MKQFFRKLLANLGYQVQGMEKSPCQRLELRFAG
jgi:hypothetical protein